MPAWMNALTMVSPDFRIDTGPPIAVGCVLLFIAASLHGEKLGVARAEAELRAAVEGAGPRVVRA